MPNSLYFNMIFSFGNIKEILKKNYCFQKCTEIENDSKSYFKYLWSVSQCQEVCERIKKK